MPRTIRFELLAKFGYAAGACPRYDWQVNAFNDSFFGDDYDHRRF